MLGTKENLLVQVADPTPAQGEEKPSRSAVYRNVAAKESWPKLPGVNSLYDSFHNSADKFGDKPCLGYRTVENGKASSYKWYTYKETAEKVANIASGMAHVGVQPHGRCGILGANCPEWMIAMQACNRQSIYCVPLYDTLGENVIEYILDHAEVSIVFTQSEKLQPLSKALPEVKGKIAAVVYWGSGDSKAADSIKSLDIKLFSFREFEELGKAHPAKPVPPTLDDLCTIMYTSGTTGDPKGVCLTHGNIVASLAGVMEFFGQINAEFSNDDAFFSYLPLAHVMDRLLEETFLHCGARIGYFQGDTRKVMDDVAALKPTLFAGVPRIFDRVYSGASAKVKAAGWLSSTLFSIASTYKRACIKAGYAAPEASPLMDRLLFHKFKGALGGHVRVILSGAAPLAGHVEDFMQVALSTPVVQGYGLTESCGASFVGVPNNNAMSGTVGVAFPALEFVLESAPELKYDAHADTPQGELCLRGPAVFQGYYKNDAATKKDVDAEGWFHTGDIAEITAAGALRIIDRKKNIFKLGQGEYVAPEKIESALKKNGLVDMVWVYGNSLEAVLVTVVVPNQKALEEWAAGAGVSGSFQELCRSDKAREHVLGELAATAKAGKLKGFEVPKGILLESKPFSVEDDLMTPSLKLKRPQLQKRYQKDIDALYNKLNPKKN